MRRSVGRQQALTTRTLVRRYTQDAGELTREAGGTDAFQEAGTMDDSGNWQSYGLLDITRLDAPFYVTED